MSLKQKKIQFKPRIKLNHNIYITDQERTVVHSFVLERTDIF